MARWFILTERPLAPVWASLANIDEWTGNWRENAQQELTPVDKNYLDTLSGENRITQFLAGRHLVYTLSKNISDAPLGIWRDHEGRPQTRAPFRISISHSQNRVAAAISQNVPIGIDIECHKPRRFAALANHYFSAAEAQTVSASPASSQQEIFYRLWCIKEAVAKLRGEGINSPLLGTDSSTLCRQYAITTRLGDQWTLALACLKNRRVIWH